MAPSDGAPGLTDAVERALAAGRSAIGDGPTAAVVLAELPSGATLGVDARGAWWIAVPGAAPARFDAGEESRFVEVLEQGRHDFDDGLERGARDAGLPAEAVLAGFPAVPLLLAVLGATSGYTARLALRWLLPSERAELLPAITRLVKNGDMPQDVRDLARHLSR